MTRRPLKGENRVPAQRDALPRRQTLLLAFESSSPAQMRVLGLASATGSSCPGCCG